MLDFLNNLEQSRTIHCSYIDEIKAINILINKINIDLHYQPEKIRGEINLDLFNSNTQEILDSIIKNRFSNNWNKIFKINTNKIHLNDDSLSKMLTTIVKKISYTKNMTEATEISKLNLVELNMLFQPKAFLINFLQASAIKNRISQNMLDFHALLFKEVKKLNHKKISKKFLVIQGQSIVRGSQDENCLLIENDQPFCSTPIPQLVLIPFSKFDDLTEISLANQRLNILNLQKESPNTFDALYCEKGFFIKNYL